MTVARMYRHLYYPRLRPRYGASFETLLRRLVYRGGRKARSALRRLQRGIHWAHPIHGGSVSIRMKKMVMQRTPHPETKP